MQDSELAAEQPPSVTDSQVLRFRANKSSFPNEHLRFMLFAF